MNEGRVNKGRLGLGGPAVQHSVQHMHSAASEWPGTRSVHTTHRSRTRQTPWRTSSKGSIGHDKLQSHGEGWWVAVRAGRAAG